MARFNCFLLLLLSVLIVLMCETAKVQSAVVCGTNFTHSCTNLALAPVNNGEWVAMEATCRTQPPHSAEVSAWIRLDQRVLNSHGSMQCHHCWTSAILFPKTKDCDFSHSCTKITLSQAGILQADCGDGHGNSIHNSIDLNDCIGNENGRLQWNECMDDSSDPTTTASPTIPALHKLRF